MGLCRLFGRLLSQLKGAIGRNILMTELPNADIFSTAGRVAVCVVCLVYIQAQNRSTRK